MTGDFVIDASVVCTWILPDEASAETEALLSRIGTTGATAPDLLWHEVRNVLMMSHRRKRIPFDKVIEGMIKVRNLPIHTRAPSGDVAIFTLAARHNLTAYDAAYLALSIETGLPLATLDKQLISAAPKEGVALLS